MKQDRLAVRGGNRRRDEKAHGRKVPGVESPGKPNSHGEVARGAC